MSRAAHKTSDRFIELPFVLSANQEEGCLDKRARIIASSSSNRALNLQIWL
jgi:hypothetical protein